MKLSVRVICLYKLCSFVSLLCVDDVFSAKHSVDNVASDQLCGGRRSQWINRTGRYFFVSTTTATRVCLSCFCTANSLILSVYFLTYFFVDFARDDTHEITLAYVSSVFPCMHHYALGVHNTKHRHQSSEWMILSHVNCFIQGKVVGFQVLLDSLHPRSTRASWWSPPVLWGGSC